ncbi:MAG: hypothetical protein QXI22_04110 [Sulfolobales archaeon]
MLRVKDRDPRSGLNKNQDEGFPHSNEPEQSYEGELWAGVTLNGWRPRIRIPMKGTLRIIKSKKECCV